MSAKSILVIDDNLVNQKLVIRYLSAKGYRAIGAANTEEADRALATEQPGIVLVDVSLPGEDGLSWVRRVRASGNQYVPMIAFTAHALPADRDKALQAGCQDILIKPIDLKSLLSITQRFCGGA